MNDEYESDEYLPAVHASNQKVSNIYNNKIRVIIGACISGVSLLAMLIIGVLSSVYPATYIEAPADVELTRATTGLIGFLKTHNLEWLFILLIITFVGGIVTIFYPKFQPILKKFRKKENR